MRRAAHQVLPRIMRALEAQQESGAPATLVDATSSEPNVTPVEGHQSDGHLIRNARARSERYLSAAAAAARYRAL